MESTIVLIGVLSGFFLMAGPSVPLCIAGLKARKAKNLGRYQDVPSPAMSVVGCILCALGLVIYTVGYFGQYIVFNTPLIGPALIPWLLRAIPMVLMFVHFVGFLGKKPAILPGIALLILSFALLQSSFTALNTLNRLQGSSGFVGTLISQCLQLSCACSLLIGSVPMLFAGSKRHGKAPALIGLFFVAFTSFFALFSHVSMLFSSSPDFVRIRFAFQFFSTFGFLLLQIAMIIYMFGKTTDDVVPAKPAPPVAPIPQPTAPQPTYQPVVTAPPVYVPEVPTPTAPPVVTVAPPPEVPKPAQLFCPYCGAKRTAGHSFCGVCGQKYS